MIHIRRNKNMEKTRHNKGNYDGLPFFNRSKSISVSQNTIK